jgi:hypothetical protein
MPNYIEYRIDENTTILVEGPAESGGVVKASRGEGETRQAQKTLGEAFKDVKAQALLLLQEIEDLHVSEAEIKFGVCTTGEVGVMAIAKLGLGVNYEVTLRWKKSE